MPSIADYGAGSGTAGLWIQDPGFPDQWNNTLYTGDWTVNKIFQHPLERKGASWSIKQNDFMTVPRVIDMAMDDQSHLYVASLIGGVFNYAGDTVGAIIRVSYPGKTPSPALRPATRTDAQLARRARVGQRDASAVGAARARAPRRQAGDDRRGSQRLALDRTAPARGARDGAVHAQAARRRARQRRRSSASPPSRRCARSRSTR